jgi:hypothetical protein
MLTKTLARRAEIWSTYRAVAADPSAGTIIPVRSKRLYQTSFTVGLARELPGVLTVLAAGASALRGEHDTAGYALAGAELIASAAVLGFIALEARHLFGRRTERASAPPQDKRQVDWSKVSAAALGYVEAWHRAHVVGHFKLVSPYVVGATTTLFLAFVRKRADSKPRKFRRPHVGITPAGISYVAGPRLRWRAEWSEVAAIEHGHRELAVRLHDGRRHVLRADDHLDGDDVLAETRAAIVAHAPLVPGASGGAAPADRLSTV